MPAVLIYIAAIVVANLTVAAFGPWVSPINAFALIGLDLALRDRLHERWQGSQLWPRMLGLIALAGLVSWWLNPAAGRIAIASVIAFCAAGLVDTLVYQRLAGRSFLQRSNGSNVAAALVDSLVFPTIAFGALLPAIVALQFAAKTLGGAVWSYLLWRVSPKLRRAV